MSGSSTLPRGAAIAYAAPAAGYLWVQLIYNHYVFKYAVDVLLIPAAAMGTILMATRLWDAISDPLVGYLTDRTRAAAGRRRPWLFGSIAPIALSSFLLWSPPAALEGMALVVWMALAILMWETAMTLFAVPYYALGAEITMDHHDRTRIAGYRHVLGGVGSLLAIGSVALLTQAEEPRDTAMWLQLIGLPLFAALLLGCFLRLREPPEHLLRGATRPLAAAASVLGNRHLLLLSAILFFEIASSGAMGIFAPFVCEYVIGNAALFAPALLALQITSYLATPAVVWLSRRFGKKRTWAGLLVLHAASFLAMLGVGPGDEAWAIGCFLLMGVGGAGAVCGLSVLADTVDWDEHRTGQRKEALHYSVVNLTRKLSFGSVAMLGGLALGWIGFEPNAEQTPETLLGLQRLFALVPGVAMLIALGLLALFRLDEREHARIRAEIDARRGEAGEER